MSTTIDKFCEKCNSYINKSMMAQAERYQEARGLRDLTSGNLVREMLISEPSIRLAGQVKLENNEALFITSPVKPTSNQEELNRHLNTMALEIPDSKVTCFAIMSTSFFLAPNDPNIKLSVGQIETSISQENGEAQRIAIKHYPHPWLADLMLVFKRLVAEDRTRWFLPESSRFTDLETRVRGIDFDEEEMARLRRLLPIIREGYRNYHAWRVPGA